MMDRIEEVHTTVRELRDRAHAAELEGRTIIEKLSALEDHVATQNGRLAKVEAEDHAMQITIARASAAAEAGSAIRRRDLAVGTSFIAIAAIIAPIAVQLMAGP